MPLTTRESWDASRDRFEAWWHGDVIDRPLLQVVAPKDDPPDEPCPACESLEQKWLDADYRIRVFEWEMARRHYAGDAFPYLDAHIGPGTLSLYLGAKAELQEHTVWYGKCVEDIPAAEPPRFDEANPYWQVSLHLAREGVKRLAGRALVSFPDLIENLDTIASLFGNRELLLALVDYSEKVHEFQRAVLSLYLKHHRRLYEIIRDDVGGSCFSAFYVYGKGAVAKLQCDFSAMISTAMFEEFVVPYLVEQCRGLDRTVYHWDGPGALQHEGPLLAMKELHAIQWTPGADQPGVGHECWWPMYHRVRDAGKSLMLNCVSPAEAQALVEEFGPEGLDLLVFASSREEADDLVRRSFDWRKQTS